MSRRRPASGAPAYGTGPATRITGPESGWAAGTSRPRSSAERAAAAQQDPEPYRSGSFDDMAAAHQEGMLSDDEYEVLSEAVAESKRAEDRRKAAKAADPA
jgi:hypothetical protein